MHLRLRCLLFAGPLVLSSPDELGERLADLSARSARVRAAAEVWLGSNARAEDFPRLLELAREGDPEVHGRLARALAREDRHLELAVSFARQAPPELARIGTTALHESALRWCDELAAAPRVGADLARILEDLAKRDAAAPVCLDLSASLETNLALLRELGDLPVALVADPTLLVRPSMPDAPERLACAPWDRMLALLAREHGLALQGFGLGTLETPGARDERWVRFAPAPVRTATRPVHGVELLAAWCERLARDEFPDPSSGRRIAAARSLASSGWPAALRWLESMWERERDEAAWEGLVLAAARGRVAPSLARPANVREIVRRADALLNAAAATPDSGSSSGPGDPPRPAPPSESARLEQAFALIDALAAVGCSGTAGEDLMAILLESPLELSARSRWWRLAVLERAVCHAPAGGALEAYLRAQMNDAEAPHVLRLQALRAWCTATGGEGRPLALDDLPGLGAPSSSWGLAGARLRLELVHRAGLLPRSSAGRGDPVERVDPLDPGDPVDPGEHVVRAAWWLLAVARPFGAEASSPSPVDEAARELQEWARGHAALGAQEGAAQGRDLARALLRDVRRQGRATALRGAFARALEDGSMEAPARAALVRLGLQTQSLPPVVRAQARAAVELVELDAEDLAAWSVPELSAPDRPARPSGLVTPSGLAQAGGGEAEAIFDEARRTAELETAAQAQDLLVLRFRALLAQDEGPAAREALVGALERSLEDLFATHQDAAALRLVGRLRRLLDGEPSAEAALVLTRRGFPGPPRTSSAPLADARRRFDPAELP